MDSAEFTVVVTHNSACYQDDFFWCTGDQVDIYEWLWGATIMDWNQIHQINVIHIEIKPWPGEE